MAEKEMDVDTVSDDEFFHDNTILIGKEERKLGEFFSELEDDKEAKEKFYKITADYWANREATIDGVLEGNAGVNNEDLMLNRELLRLNMRGNKLVLEAGAGIGRFTDVLKEFFDEIHVVEPTLKYLEKVKRVENVSGWYP